ncbi:MULTISPECIES: hypothetical protein [unclassified Microcoleus]|uniref:hypothetical protein n=1 Tax=unclassified Microcoleus TaxID=2642155 RepID=UPI0025CD9601|nr:MULTISPECIES: hypothetical protein [unclassified Microcoleus]
MPNYNMRGVQFLTDNEGNKTAAIVDLKEHSEFWVDVLAECGEPTDFQFLVDGQGEKIAVLLDFEKHGELWEDVYDSLTIESRQDEPRVPWEEVKRQLEEKGMLNV